MRRPVSLLLLVLAALIATLSGCGGGASGATTPSTAFTDVSSLLGVPTPAPVAATLNASAPWVFAGGNPTFADATADTNVVGRLNAVVARPGQPDLLLAATAGGGVWKSTDRGQSWTPRTDFVSKTLGIGSLAFDPGNPDSVYAGTGESHASGSSMYGSGILHSDDFGDTWRVVSGTDTQFAFVGTTCMRVYHDGTGRKHVLVGTLDLGWNPRFQYGAYESVDDGPFTPVLPAGTQASVSGLAVDPKTRDVYMGLYLSSDAADNGVWVRDGNTGDVTRRSSGMPEGAALGRIELAAAADGSRVYAFVADPQGRHYLGVYVTTDHGQHWQLVTGTVNGAAYQGTLGDLGWYCLPIVVDPKRADRVYIACNLFSLRLDGIDPQAGTTTAVTAFPIGSATTPHADFHGLAFDDAGVADGGPRLLAATDGGLWSLASPASAEPGAIWENLNGVAGQAMATLQATGIAVNARDTTQLSMGTQDNGSMLFLDNQVGREVLGGDGGFTVFDNLRQAVYVSTQRQGVRDFLHRLTFRNGAMQDQEFVEGISEADPGQFYAPFVQHPTAPDRRLAVGTNRVYERRESDVGWMAVSPTLSDSVTALAYAPSDPFVLYVGCADGSVYVRQADGSAFSRRALGLPRGRSVASIAIDPRVSGNAYVCFRQVGLDRIFRTTDFGSTWTRITNDLPTDLPADALALDGSQSELPLIYLATDRGVYASINAASAADVHWTVFGQGLPNVQVACLALQGRVLTAGTHGRSVWQIALDPSVVVTTPPAVQLSRQIPNQPPIFEVGEGDKRGGSPRPRPKPRER